MLGRVPRSRGLKRRGSGGRYEVDKVPVFAFIERGGARLFTAAKDVTESTILALVELSNASSQGAKHTQTNIVIQGPQHNLQPTMNPSTTR
jgi:hypothetical protein